MPSVKSLTATFTPAEFDALSRQDLAETTCVVFDVLRATSSMITALSSGATAIIPVARIDEALDIHRKDPGVLLAGERDGLRITANLTGGIGFDLGNSPREFTPAAVQGRVIAMTTTNGTRALRACAGARAAFISSFLNLRRTSEQILAELPEKLVLICSGTFEEAAYEDILAAGALCELLWDSYSAGAEDSALAALRIWQAARGDLFRALAESRNGKRLLSRPDLAEDVAFCATRDTAPILAGLDSSGRVTVVQQASAPPETRW